MEKTYQTRDDASFAEWTKKAKKKLLPVQIVVTLFVVTLFYVARGSVFTADVMGTPPITLLTIAVCAFVSVCAISTSVVVAFENSPIRTICMVILTALAAVVTGMLTSSRIYTTTYSGVAIDCCFLAAFCIVPVFLGNNAVDEASGSSFSHQIMARRKRVWIELATIAQFICIMILLLTPSIWR